MTKGWHDDWRWPRNRQIHFHFLFRANYSTAPPPNHFGRNSIAKNSSQSPTDFLHLSLKDYAKLVDHVESLDWVELTRWESNFPERLKKLDKFSAELEKIKEEQ